MAEQPSPRRRFQFRLRTLFVIFTVVAVIMATLPLLTRPVMTPVMGQMRTIKGEKGNDLVLADVPVDLDASWRFIVLLVDTSAIGLAVWLVKRKP